MPPRQPSRRPRRLPGDVRDVSRMEFENIESAVRANAEKLRSNGAKIDRLELRLDELSRQLTELIRAVRALR